MRTIPVLLNVLLCAISISGCTSLSSTKIESSGSAPAIEKPTQSADQAYWWHIRFQLRRDAEGETQSFIDALIADQVISPILNRFKKQISLWRFHRRWPRDKTGHQFSFIFYTTIDTAKQVRTEAQTHPLLDALRSAGVLRQVVLDQSPSETRSRPADTSDPSWPVEVQREWPNYIMGASRMWLGLIKAEAAKRQELTLLERYQGVEQALAEIWYTEANHAFFHHLSALFGYKPMRVIRQDIMTF